MSCQYCKKKNHVIDNCPTIICKTCGTRGHPRWLCPTVRTEAPRSFNRRAAPKTYTRSGGDSEQCDTNDTAAAASAAADIRPVETPAPIPAGIGARATVSAEEVSYPAPIAENRPSLFIFAKYRGHRWADL